jgi:hypothetical protein
LLAIENSVESVKLFNSSDSTNKLLKNPHFDSFDCADNSIFPSLGSGKRFSLSLRISQFSGTPTENLSH